MITDAARRLWDLPRAEHAPHRVWRDWALVGALLAAGVLEAALRQDLTWRAPSTVVGLGVVALLLWRRTRPLLVTATAFGALILFDLTSIARLGSVPDSLGLWVTAAVVLLPYALVRWGSGRAIVLGLLVALGAYAVAILGSVVSGGDAVAAFIFFMSPAVGGAAVRVWTESHARDMDRARLREREQLARELHDTVAHHVTAIVVRAQAGRVAAADRPAAAVDALEVIEAEGSRTLAEMRAMVGALRDDDEVPLAPQHGLADIAALAGADGARLPLEVRIAEDVEPVGPAVGAAVYRIAQEAATNARRHARHASRIDVEVARDGDAVRLTVDDDGDPVAGVRTAAGYGIVGMTERAGLLGGTLTAGPGSPRGWTVRATIPAPRWSR